MLVNGEMSTTTATALSVDRMSIRNTSPRYEKQCPNEKAPCEQRWGSMTAPLLAKSAIPAAREGSLAYGFSADYSGGTAAELHGLPRCPCLQK